MYVKFSIKTEMNCHTAFQPKQFIENDPFEKLLTTNFHIDSYRQLNFIIFAAGYVKMEVVAQ